MGTYTILLPDVGEGIAEAEITEWDVSLGDVVAEDDVLGAVMTDKAAVEVPSRVSGTVTWLSGEIGDILSVGAAYVKLEVLGEGNEKDIVNAPSTVVQEKVTDKELVKNQPPLSSYPAFEQLVLTSPQNALPRRTSGQRPLASPAVRKRAREEGVDLRQVSGTAPADRITHDDLEQYLTSGTQVSTTSFGKQNQNVKSIKVLGMRRKIAEKMSLSKSRIPHITIVEEIDVESLEHLRKKLNDTHKGQREKLTVLPFMMRAIVLAVDAQPQMNARFDDDQGLVHQYSGVNIGIATQTPNGLAVPVVKHVEALSPWDCAYEVSRLAEVSRAGKATRDELTGSTITITSLGSLGAISTTPIINHPEVAIVGINKMAVRPMWDGHQFQPRKMMNISCAFDHRVIDGMDAALFVQKLKSLLETPAMLFVEG